MESSFFIVSTAKQPKQCTIAVDSDALRDAVVEVNSTCEEISADELRRALNDSYEPEEEGQQGARNLKLDDSDILQRIGLRKTGHHRRPVAARRLL